MNIKSIGTKLAFQLAVVLIVTVTIFGALDISLRRRQFIALLDAREENTLQQLSLIMGELLFFMNIEPLDNIVHSYIADLDIVSIKVFEGDHVINYVAKEPQSGKLIEAPGENMAPPQYESAVTRRTPVQYDGQELGTVEVTFSRKFMTSQVNDTLLLLSGELLLLLVATIAAVLLLARRNITNPLSRLIEASGEIADGKLATDVGHISSHDETGRLSATIHNMAQRLREVVAQVKTSSTQVVSSSSELRNSVEDISRGLSGQASAAAEASSSMEEMTANIKQNAENARQNETIAVHVAKIAQEGGQAVAKTATVMQAIARKISIIGDIARQTRMLSLNATIEAARAESYGQGFAVVASEVRALAERSQQAAAEITSLTESGVLVAEQAGEMLNTLVPQIQKTSELVQEISAASREQSSGAEQINQAIHLLDEITGKNAMKTEQISQTIQGLADEAGRLEEMVRFFDVEDSLSPETKAL